MFFVTFRFPGRSASLHSPIRLVRSAGLLLVLGFLAACETTGDVASDQPEPSQAGTADTLQSDTAAVTEYSVASPATLREALSNAAADGTPYQFEALRIPAGTWDGYAQASNSAFLQCLVAWGPREARLGISAGWPRDIYVQFHAPEWPVTNLMNQADLVVAVDDFYERSLPLEGKGQLLWINLGQGPEFAQSLMDGSQLTLRVDNHVMVYPLADAKLAMQALYECLALHTEESDDGGFSIYGVKLADGTRAKLTETTVRALLENGFGDVRLREERQTAEQYGSRVFLSGPAWAGEAELFASVFGVQGDSKKALIEAVNDVARLCRGEVQARLIRMDEPNGIGQFGRSSLLCGGASGEFVLESFAYFNGRIVLVIHAVVDDVNERSLIDESFEALMADMNATS
jgi:hypothetical protein